MTPAKRSKLDLPPAESRLILWHLQNPTEVAEHGVSFAKLQRIATPQELPHTERPLLFLHGVEYDGANEVLRDFVQPFLSSMLQKSTPSPEKNKSKKSNLNVFFVDWNSALLSTNARSEIQKANSSGKRVFQFVKRMPWWGRYFKDVEDRARLASEELHPFVMHWMESKRVGPTVISHSLGAKVWAETLMRITQSCPSRLRPGIWWNLQPALSHRAFATGGEYDIIPRLYQNDRHAKTVVWYSRFDFVLSTLFLVAKGDRAIGQFGCPEQSVPQRDVTWWTQEAHGMNHIRGNLGNFFRRASAIIPDEAKALGII